MVDKPEQKDTKVYTAYTKTRSWVASSLGILLAIIGVGVVFFISSLEGTKEIKANNNDSVIILSQWRNRHNKGEGDFPEERTQIFNYDGKEYYFVITDAEFIEGTSERVILDWYFAYEGGLGYIFSDYKFWVLTTITIFIAMYVANVNYVSSVRAVVNGQKFAGTLKYYADAKNEARPYSQYIPKYCVYKNKQSYNDKKRDIIEQADIDYDKYIEEKIDITTLHKWQLRTLKRIKRIKVQRIKTKDLMQEHSASRYFGANKVKLLPPGVKEHQRRFLTMGFFQKFMMAFLSGLTVGFGIVVGNWATGITYAVTIVVSYVSAVIIATDFAENTLRNRFIGKADLLIEFSNLREQFIDKSDDITIPEEVVMTDGKFPTKTTTATQITSNMVDYPKSSRWAFYGKGDEKNDG